MPVQAAYSGQGWACGFSWPCTQLPTAPWRSRCSRSHLSSTVPADSDRAITSTKLERTISALGAAVTSAPTVTTGPVTPASLVCGERPQSGRARVARDLTALSFRVSPHVSRQCIADADARRVRMVRRVTAARLRYCGLPGLVDDATIIVSELVTNAIVHSGGTKITFTMTVGDGFLHIYVRDEMPGVPMVHDSDGESERGRGLFLVSSLAEEHAGAWGFSDGGAITWCRLAIPAGQQP
ncbi:ATP-binding protein [Streptomyces mirabilis]|uniref:ATP-binding protein n=1 Tax=Streptomyces mirabilis TaxID=68239 RepID=UPI0036B494B7